jgi:hypothetical protein
VARPNSARVGLDARQEDMIRKLKKEEENKKKGGLQH